MSQVRAVIKAYRVSKLLDQLAFAKKNAVRAHYGLPPIVPWYEKFYINCMNRIRVSFMETCCPCVLYLRNRRRRMRTCCGRLGLSGTYENDVLKTLVGFCGGMLITLFVYFLMVFKMDFAASTSAVVCVFLGVFLTVGLAFSLKVRCYILLIAPQFFSSRGRTFLILYAFVLVMANPVKNVTHNVLVLSEAATCGQSVVYNQTREMVEAALSPMAAIVDGIRAVLEAIQTMAEMLRIIFLSLKRAVDDIAAAIHGALEWLTSIVDVCNEKMMGPYRKCKRAFDDAYNECMEHLAAVSFITCDLVGTVSGICVIFRIAELLCILVSYLKKLMKKKLGAPISRAIYNVYEMFYVNITVHYHYSLTSEQSRSYEEVRESIMEEIKSKIKSYDGLIDFLSNTLGLTVVFVFVKAIYYRHKYLTDDSYDNRYVNKALLAIEEKRKEKKKETIFPLSANENLKYIKPWTLILTLPERRKMLRGIVMYLSSAVYAAFYLMCDFGLYWMLDMIRRHFEVKVHRPVPAAIKMHVQGEGIIADMYRALISLFDPLTSLDTDLDTTSCLPHPSVPNYDAYKTVGWIYGVCFFLTLFEAYGMRMRHVVMGMYFPKRARSRAAWLYNHIIKQRGGFLKFTRRQLRRKYRQDSSVKKASIRGRLIAQFPFLTNFFRLLGYDRKRCLCCGAEGNPRDFVNFYHCPSGDCDAVYCADCYSDINNICTVCMNPVDYGDISDESEEVDSSEDEQERQRKIELSKERRAKIEASKQAKTPEMLLGQFQSFAAASQRPQSSTDSSATDSDDSDDDSSSSTNEADMKELMTKYEQFLTVSNKPSASEDSSSNDASSGSGQVDQGSVKSNRDTSSKANHVLIQISSSDSETTSSSDSSSSDSSSRDNSSSDNSSSDISSPV